MNKRQSSLIIVCALSILMHSCNREPVQKQTVSAKMACYQSVSGMDTAWLSIDTAQTPISGALRFNYTGKKQLYEGQFKGKMHGDTLKGHFDFKINQENPPFRNPVAFLKKDGRLHMGVGQFMLVMGTAHFDDQVAIDYDRARFVFEEVACAE